VRARAADAPPLVADYLERVREFNGGDALKQYPGSPAFAHALQRPQDQLSLFELHPTDHRVLSSYLGKEAGCEVRMVDGFEALKSRLPPPTRRGLVLVDPSYELDRDYARVVSVLRESLQRFADGSYLVWYPQVGKVQAAELPKRLRNLTSGPWLHARLTVARPDARGFGMSGSGVFVFNPPHTLHAQLKTVLPWLHEVLKQFDGGGWQLDQKAM
jgi:23S rRNA (adenine2030-N6)-methyltransferase